MNTADIEREKALKAQNGGTPVEEKKPLFTPKTAEEYQAIKENPTVTTPTLEGSEEAAGGEDAASSLMKAAGVGESGNPLGLEGAATPKFEKQKSLADKINEKGTSWKEKALAETLEKNATPEQRLDLAGETLEEASQEGLAANKALQNTEIPKLKRATIKDVLFDPAYEGIRDSIIANQIGAVGANFLAGKNIADSELNKYNREQAARYSGDVAKRDAAATQAQIDAINAANKRDVGETLQRADFNVDRELDRAGLLFDTETKNQVLKKMAENSQEFAKLYPNPEDRMLLTAYQQYLSGDATMLDSLLSVYGPELAERLGPLVDKMLGIGADKSAEGDAVATSFGGHDYTVGEINNLGAQGFYDAMTRANLTNEEKEEIIAGLERKYGTGGDMKKIRRMFENEKKGEALTDEYNEKLLAETNDRASSLESDIAGIVNNGNLDEKQKKKQLEDLKSQLDADMSKNLLAETPALKTAKANLDNAIAKNNLAIEVKSINKPLQKNVKLNFDKNDNLNKEDADDTMKYFAGLDWNKLINENTGSVTNRAEKLEAVKATAGYKDVLDFFKNPKVKAYAYDKDAGKNYKYAVNKFCEAFGGEPKDYGFLNVTW
jgi:hypothetical protein